VTYTLSDDDGTELRVEPGAPGCAILEVSDSGGSAALAAGAAEFPAITSALWEAAGYPAPVMLPRPEIADGIWEGVRLAVAVHAGKVRLRADGERLDLEPPVARVLAAVIAIKADEAGAEPDAGRVRTLAALIDASERVSGDTTGLAACLLRAGVRLGGGRDE